MGGHALKNTKTRRYDKEEYFSLADKVLSILPEGSMVIPAYGDKETFGDMDILIAGPAFDNQTTVKFKKKFNGGLVMELTGLTGKELGSFMGSLKETPDFMNKVLFMPEAEVAKMINYFYEAYEELRIDRP